MDGRYSPFAHIRSVVNEDGGVLLDLKRGRCLSLNPVGGQVWKVFQRHSEGLTVDSLVDELLPGFDGVERNTLLRDMSKFLPELEGKGLISNGNGTHSLPSSSNITLPRLEQVMSPPATASISNNESSAIAETEHEPYAQSEDNSFFYSLLAMAALVGVDLILKLAGFPWLYRIISKWPTRRLKDTEQSNVARICASVDAACRFYLKRALCLQRSVVATCLLRLAGIPAQMVIAARVMPLQSHAWVEVDGRVVNDSNKVQEFYSVLDRC